MAQRVERVVVIGAGMVGLSTAWHLQERGADVVVIDRSGVAAGSSWGNAGWISPGLAVPLSDPSVLKYGLKALLDSASPLFIPLRPDPRLMSFLLGFARRCTLPQWKRTMATFVPLNERAIDAFQHLEDNGVAAKSYSAPIMAAFRAAKDSAGLEHEIELIREAGLDLKTEEIDNAQLRQALPIVSDGVEKAIRIDGQRFINPGEYCQALSDAIIARGGQVLSGANAHALRHGPKGVTVELTSGEPVSGDAVVLATGAWLPDLAKACGMKTPLRAGRGYSFSLGVTEPGGSPVANPIYFPYERIACTPVGDRLRVGGTMEFAEPDEPMHPARIDAIVAGGRPLLSGVDWEDRQDEWFGSRPVPVDGLPLIGATDVPGVYVNGGHGMWGITLGPLSGQLLAEEIMTNSTPQLLRQLRPTR